MLTAKSCRSAGARFRRRTWKGGRLDLSKRASREGDFIFVGHRTGAQQYPMALRHLLRRRGHNVTAHGFRSSFRDWAEETTAYPNHVVEQALAHAISSGVEAAYRRGDLFEKRRELMETWAHYCAEGAL